MGVSPTGNPCISRSASTASQWTRAMAEISILKDASCTARLLVMLISVPVILLVVVGGVLSRTVPAADSYQHLRVFDDVVTLVMNNYVEQVETDKIAERRDARACRRARPDCAG